MKYIGGRILPKAVVSETKTARAAMFDQVSHSGQLAMIHTIQRNDSGYATHAAPVSPL